jgi:LL-diaminopimelate aminotransferase
VDPGDLVLCPSPGYPPYSRGTLFAEGEPYHLPLLAERDFLLDLGAIPSAVARRAKVLWINYPNSPSGAVAPRSFLQEVLEFAAGYDLIIASDEAYSEIFFGEPPLSMLNVSKQRVLAFNSLSKRSAMTCYRVGWVAGDPDLVDLFRQVKTNLDSGTPTFIQDGAVAALNDETHVRAFREEYRHKRDLLCAALVESGLPDCRPDATLYVWQRVPEHLSAVEFATVLLQPEIGIVTTPGSWIAETNPGQPNPGEDYVRFALVPSVADTERAAELLRRARF